MQNNLNEKITVVIADDHPIWLDGLINHLNKYPQFEVIGCAKDGIELFNIINKKIPDLILLDIRMPNMNGDEALKIIATDFPSIEVIVMSEFCTDDSMVVYYIEKGASFALNKFNTADDLISSIVSVMAGKPNFSENILSELISREKINNRKSETLTAQEKQILLCFCKQKSVKEVAEHFNLSPSTIKHHKANIYRKTKCLNEAGLMQYAFKRGWF